MGTILISDKMLSRFLLLILLNFALLVTTNISYAATYYVNPSAPNDAGTGGVASPKKYIQSGITLLAPGDTLILEDGVYTGSSNTIVSGLNQLPPSGSAVAGYTKIMARNIGKAIVDGESIRVPVYVYGRNYLHIDGIVFKNSSASLFVIEGGANNFAHHIKVTRCGFCEVPDTLTSVSRYNGVNFSWVEKSLIEDCYMWGNAKYFFYILKSRYIVLRRCVVRIDRTTDDSNLEGTYNTAAFRLYFAHNIALQNNIVIDSDQNNQYVQNLTANPMQNIPHMFYTQGVFVDGSGNFETGGTIPKASNKFTGNIGLNNIGMMVYFARSGDGITENDLVSDSVFWGFDKGIWARYGSDSVPALFKNITIGNIRSTMGSTKDKFVTDDKGGWMSVSNSVLYNMKIALDNVKGVGTGNNAFYLNTTNYANSATVSVLDKTSINPITNGLKYLVRTEPVTALNSYGTRLGAEIVYQIGVTGTIYGENGYDTVTAIPLWPWPYEDVIKAQMSTYNLHGVNGARGFAAAGKRLDGINNITLTSYIWEYLGNPIPSGIYPPAAPAALQKVPIVPPTP